jgi:hypothetical protein
MVRASARISSAGQPAARAADTPSHPAFPETSVCDSQHLTLSDLCKAQAVAPGKMERPIVEHVGCFKTGDGRLDRATPLSLFRHKCRTRRFEVLR